MLGNLTDIKVHYGNGSKLMGDKLLKNLEVPRLTLNLLQSNLIEIIALVE